MTEITDNWETSQKILVILAHPDDPEFFCGGTLAKWARAGHEITYFLLTCGDKGFNPATHPEMTPEKLCGIRHAEQNNAAKVIGVNSVHFMDLADGYLVPDLNLRRDIVREIRRFKPDILVTCDPQNLFAQYGINHPDHRYCGQVVLDAVFPAAGNIAYFPELLAGGFQPHMPKEVWCSLTSQPNTTSTSPTHGISNFAAMPQFRNFLFLRKFIFISPFCIFHRIPIKCAEFVQKHGRVVEGYGIITPMQTNIIGVRFTKIGKIYHFDSSTLPDVKKGEHVIVDTVRGKHLGEVVQILEEAPPQPEGGWKSVERRATPRDLLLQQSWQAKQTEAMINCRARASELRLKDVKIVTAEYNYDGSRLSFLFSTESEEKAELKSLKKDMSQLYPTQHVEMRQIGPRDVAKFLGGMGACGIETRCCSQFLTDFSPISIKMAKEQGISLTPNEITGMCGRLRCCLIYEYEQYVEARKTLPKRNKRVVTPKGEGKVVDLIPMSDKVVVLIESGTDRPQHMTFSREEIEPWDELEALRRKSQAPCDRHEGGGCTCSKGTKKNNDRNN